MTGSEGQLRAEGFCLPRAFLWWVVHLCPRPGTCPSPAASLSRGLEATRKGPSGTLRAEQEPQVWAAAHAVALSGADASAPVWDPGSDPGSEVTRP